MYPREASVGTSSHSVPVYTVTWTLCVEHPNPTLNELVYIWAQPVELLWYKYMYMYM